MASEPPIKKKKLPSALDALNKATTTFLDASKAQPEPEDVISIFVSYAVLSAKVYVASRRVRYEIGLSWDKLTCGAL